MASLTLRYFCYGCLATSFTWSVLLLLYFSLINEPIRSQQPVRPRPPANHQPITAKHNAEIAPEMGMIFNEADQELRDSGYHRHAFNVLISTRLGYHRDIPDTRDTLCVGQVYPPSLPSASVIICFFNEALSALLRTVHSVLDRTPSYLLHEIILVDDHSELDELKADLDRYMEANLKQKVKLVRNKQREGLIRGRMVGAKHATGEVLVFLDSHCEVNRQWVEPLLTQIQTDRQTVVCPVIDIISADTLTYSPSPIVRGGFNWGLHFKWDPVPPKDLSGPHGNTAPIRSPTMAGGLFAMDRKYFNDLGQYDAGMDIWGGENLEISFRIWMCGGTLLIMPCSRVGHIFRKRRPYGSPGGQDSMSHNSLRLAHVWMDEYKEQYLSLRPELRGRGFGDISSRVSLRERLQCKPFSWYLSNIYPEMAAVAHGNNKQQQQQQNLFVNKGVRRPKVLQRGRLRNLSLGRCLVAQGRASQKGGNVVLKPCDHRDPEQKCPRSDGKMLILVLTKIEEDWSYDEEGQLVLAALLCLDVSETRTFDPPRLMKCHGSGGSQQWTVGKANRLYQVSVGQCLSAEGAGLKGYVAMAICDASRQQQWQLET